MTAARSRCATCDLRSLIGQQACYRLMHYCTRTADDVRPYEPSENAGLLSPVPPDLIDPAPAGDRPEHVHTFRLRYVCDCGEPARGQTQEGKDRYA